MASSGRTGSPLPRNMIGIGTVECRVMRATFQIPTFDQRRREVEGLGFDCVAWHLGREVELVGSGIVPLEDVDVVVARFVRRSDKQS